MRLVNRFCVMPVLCIVMSFYFLCLSDVCFDILWVSKQRGLKRFYHIFHSSALPADVLDEADQKKNKRSKSGKVCEGLHYSHGSSKGLTFFESMLACSA